MVFPDGREREEDSQAPPDLEPVQVEPGVAEMGQFGDEGYEPSADELIDVLKNLENLAAANPGLYRAIVEQIKGRKSDDVMRGVREGSKIRLEFNGFSARKLQFSFP